MSKARKRRSVPEDVITAKVISFLQRPVTQTVAAVICKVISRLSARQLYIVDFFLEKELQARAEKDDAEAKDEMLIKDACSLDRLQMMKRQMPEYYERVDKKLSEIFPDRPRLLRGKSWGAMSRPTMVAYMLCYRLGTLKMEYDLSLPPFSKATYSKWLRPLRGLLEYEYGQDFERHPVFAGYWRKGEHKQHLRTHRGEVRDAIWKDLKQSIKTIAPAIPPESGTKRS